MTDDPTATPEAEPEQPTEHQPGSGAPATAEPASAALGANEANAPEPAIRFHAAAVNRGGRTLWEHGEFTIPRGALVVLLGPNGSGKTTLLHTVLGLQPLSHGSVEVLGSTPRRGDPRIGYVPQNYTATIGNAVRARDLVALGITGGRWGLGRLSPEERDRVEHTLEAVGAGDFANRRMSTLSGGQQQRVAIAQALVSKPELLLLDEPLANLDVRNQDEVVDLLSGLGDDADMTVLVVAHDVNPLLSVLTGAVYLLDGHPHYDTIGEVVDERLLMHLYGTRIRVVRTAQGDLFTRSAR
jgi:zinc/manganese transport system ATP-binding protein